MPELTLDELCLLGDVQPRQPDRDLVAEAALVVHGHLQRGRRRLAPGSADAHPVSPDLVQLDGVEAAHHIGVQVSLALDLIQQLGGDRADRDLPAGARVLADDTGAVGCDLRPREPWVGHVGDLGEEAVVAAGGLPAALDHMPGDDGAGKRIPVVTSPAVMPCRRTGHHGCIGGSPGDDDVCTLVQRLDDPPAADVGVGGHDSIGQLAEGLAGVEMGKVVAGCDQLPQPVGEVVTVDIGDGRAQTQPVRHLGHGVGAPRRIETAGVGHHLDAPAQAGAHDFLHLRDEGAGVAGAGSLGGDARQDQHGQLGQPVAREGVDRSPRHHLPGGRQPVSEEAAAVGYPDGRCGGRAHVRCLSPLGSDAG